MNEFITVILVALFATCQSDEEVGELKCPLHWVDGTEYGLGCIMMVCQFRLGIEIK